MPNTQEVKKISLAAALPEHLAGLRLDQALAHLFPEYSRSRLQDWISGGYVSVDGKHGKQLRAKGKVHSGQYIEINVEMLVPSSAEGWQAQPMTLDILYADPHLLVINKPAGLVVHPAIGNPDRTLV